MRSSDSAMRSTNSVRLAPASSFAGVHAAERVGEHELGPQQAHAVDGQGGDRLGVLGAWPG